MLIAVLGGAAFLLLMIGGGITSMLSCFHGASLNESFDPTQTEGYALCQEIYENYFEELEERMDEEEKQIIKDNTYIEMEQHYYILNGIPYYFEVPVSKCDVRVRRQLNGLNPAYLMAYISTIANINSDRIRDQVDAGELAEYVQTISPLRQVWVSDTEAVLYNDIRTIDEIASIYFPDYRQAERLVTSFELYLGFLGDYGLLAGPIDGLEYDAPDALVHGGGMKIPHYFQTDYRNVKYGGGSIASSGCAPTCIAMVVSYLTGTDVTPPDVAAAVGNRYYVPGTGSSWSIFSSGTAIWGIAGRNLGTSSQIVFSELQTGHPVIVSMGPGTFTKGGHFLVIRGITSDGKFLVNDPNRNNYKKYGTDAFSIDLVMREAKNFWSFCGN